MEASTPVYNVVMGLFLRFRSLRSSIAAAAEINNSLILLHYLALFRHFASQGSLPEAESETNVPFRPITVYASQAAHELRRVTFPEQREKHKGRRGTVHCQFPSEAQIVQQHLGL